VHHGGLLLLFFFHALNFSRPSITMQTSNDQLAAFDLFACLPLFCWSLHVDIVLKTACFIAQYAYQVQHGHGASIVYFFTE
jgi:hypothetical protein